MYIHTSRVSTIMPNRGGANYTLHPLREFRGVPGEK